MYIKIYIKAQSAETGPPLGTVLGNIGVNTVKFSKEFNEYTKDLPSYFKLGVSIFIEENKSYYFSVKEPSLGSILSLLKKEDTRLKKDGSVITFYFITVEELLQVCKFKFPNLSFEKSIPIIFGSLNAALIEVK